MDTTRTGLGGRGNGVLEEWSTLREERDVILEKRAKSRGGKKLDLFRWKIKIERKGRSKTYDKFYGRGI